ncbi:MAG: hypothetical protein COV72_09375 [Candidatus Omnitrophica bacterium CG11_big_fil_rev_8_21_14_0_20_42_13]|uniref:Uncharacterized protein n=1 Tax=Candidatus Ghiorseimicrobium undicola TaxID=1974746 RepID=A0A2H0LX49_9BACT|nr:MAG: hypothetical protein COV72_09375 [Candidatus Omnitrophica bacterium CG11_big_fil_rev_8_21_14_0_20_42_13]
MNNNGKANTDKHKVKALVLFSGGLDSLIALKLIKDSGIELLALNFVSPFCRCNRSDGCSAVMQLKNLDVEFKLIRLAEEYLEIVKKPKFGYGSNMNPCIDCRVLMFKKAKAVMQEVGASFLITGEVLGQRPMSQQKRQFGLIEKEAEVEGLVFRPLSAKLLPQTLAEKEGWLKDNVLLNLSGRIRSPQIKMAKELGVNDYPCPSGGCLLTDIGFSRRLRDLIKHSRFTLDEVELLKIGRHFRLNDKLKLIVGRDEKENNRLLDIAQKRYACFIPCDVKGPVAIASGLNGEVELDQLCVSIVARYCDRNKEAKVKVEKRNIVKGGSVITAEVPASEELIEKFRI